MVRAFHDLWSELHTKRLHLRALRASDAGPIGLYASDSRVACMTTSIPHPYPPGAAENFISASLSGRSGELVWVIDATRCDGPEFVGVIGFRPQNATLGYWVGPAFWGTGYASEAAEALCRHLVNDCGVTELLSAAFEDNPASLHVLEKTGFEATGAIALFCVARGTDVPSRKFRLRAG